METEEQKPWYHGVKWTLIRRQAEGHAGDTIVISEESGHGFIARMWNGRTNRDRYAELLAAAPETATERDRLLSVNKQLLEALDIAERNLVSSVPYCDGLRLSGLEGAIDTVRAAIQAAKASS